MTLSEAMASLKSMGTEQNRKVYARHGASADTFGVSFANLAKLRKEIGIDNALARQLWETGNSDARILATMIADPSAASAKELDAMVKSIRYYVLADAFSGFVAKTPHALSKLKKWIPSAHDFTSQCGFDILSLAALHHQDLPDAFFEEHLVMIEKSIHNRKNRTRHAMNNAVIAIGLRNPKLRKLAIAAAKRIGKVEVDHGETGCKTPDAVAYIKKALEHKSAKSAKQKA